MATQQSGNGKETKLPLNAEALERFIRLQEREADARILEAKNQAQENEANRQIALASIEAQTKNLADNREKYNRHLIHRYILVAVCLAGLLAFAGFAIKNGATELVMDMMKVGGGMIAGGVGGYFAGKSAASGRQSSDE